MAMDPDEVQSSTMLKNLLVTTTTTATRPETKLELLENANALNMVMDAILITVNYNDRWAKRWFQWNVLNRNDELFKHFISISIYIFVRNHKMLYKINDHLLPLIYSYLWWKKKVRWWIIYLEIKKNYSTTLFAFSNPHQLLHVSKVSLNALIYFLFHFFSFLFSSIHMFCCCVLFFIVNL